jgi:GNAT superfamily N-acetyltransferase
VPEPRHFLHVARCNGVPAGTAGWVNKHRSAYLVGAVVLPAHRRRGVYRALIDARLEAVARRGITLATTHARETTSAPILEKLGFETMYRYELFTNAM